MIRPSGEEKSPVAVSCLVGFSGLLRNVLFASMAASTRYSPLALGLAVWSQGVMGFEVCADHLMYFGI